jgi:hypothetical protein
MKMKYITTGSLLLVVLLAVAGCGTVTVDHIPSGSPKGYVEFYMNNYAPFKISEVVGGEEKRCGVVGGWASPGINYQRYALRIAEEPGMHSFVVEHDTFTRGIDVEVTAGMITPVFIYYKSIYQNRYSSYESFQASLDLEDKIPIEQSGTK